MGILDVRNFITIIYCLQQTTYQDNDIMVLRANCLETGRKAFRFPSNTEDGGNFTLPHAISKRWILLILSSKRCSE